MDPEVRRGQRLDEPLEVQEMGARTTRKAVGGEDWSTMGVASLGTEEKKEEDDGRLHKRRDYAFSLCNIHSAGTPLPWAQCRFSDLLVGWRISAMGLPGCTSADAAGSVILGLSPVRDSPVFSVHSGTAYKC